MYTNLKSSKLRSKTTRRFVIEQGCEDDSLAPVMPAIDVVQQLIEEECRQKRAKDTSSGSNSSEAQPGTSGQCVPRNQSGISLSAEKSTIDTSSMDRPESELKNSNHITTPVHGSGWVQPVITKEKMSKTLSTQTKAKKDDAKPKNTSIPQEACEEDHSDILVRNNPLLRLINKNNEASNLKQDDYEFVPKSVILDVYSNDPEVKRFLKQLPRIFNESGYNEQDYKCYSCRRPVGLVFGQSRLCHFDGHHYCSECHLSEKSVIPARILCNWDFNRYPVSKRNQHFLTLISNEPMFELRRVSPMLYEFCPDLDEIEELRRQAFFVRSYCTTCVQESISFELTKLVWPREHLIKQTDLYSLEDLIQIKGGSLKQVLKNVITFGRQHVLSCVLCCQKGFICEICKSSQIIYPFDTESVHRCNACHSIYHKACFKSRTGDNSCPRCQRLKARRDSKDRP